MGKKKSAEDIRCGLAHIRNTRRLFLAILFAFLPITALTMAYIQRSGQWAALAIPFALFALGMVIQHILQHQRCPRCREFFFVQKMTKTTYTPCSSYSFPPQKKCQHCSLALYK